MMDKKRIIFGLSVCLTAAIIVGTAFDFTNNSYFSIKNARADEKTLTFDGANHVQLGGGISANYTQKFDYNGNTQADGPISLHYTQCKYNDSESSYHVRCLNGGIIEKTDESYHITSITVYFGGHDSSGQPVIRLYPSKSDAKSDVSQETNYIEITAVSGVANEVIGFNYWKVINTVGTTNMSVSFTFGCTERISSFDSLSAILKPNIYYYSGREPKASDFDITCTYTIGGVSHSAPLGPSQVDVDYPDDFFTNGGDITLSSFGATDTVHVSNIYSKTGDPVRYEAEDSTVSGATSVTQLAAFADDHNPVIDTEFTIGGADQISSIDQMLAGAFLNYSDESGLKASGNNNLGGLVTYMDKSRKAKMTFTIESDKPKKAILTIRGASNDSAGSYAVNTLNINNNLSIKVNNISINDYIDPLACFRSFIGSSSDANNRNYSVGGISCNGRFRFIQWTELELGVISLKAGTNTIVIESLSQTGGNWDYIELQDLEGNEPLLFECEDATLGKGTYKIVQLTNSKDYANFVRGKDFIDDCGYHELHSRSYLGYQDTKYGCHGTGSYGGFVHYFNNKSTMTFTFNCAAAERRTLYVCGATNKNATLSNHTISDLYLSSSVNITLNNNAVNVPSSAIFHGKSDTTPDPDANRSGYDGRYVYLLWELVEIGDIDLQEGENTIVFTGKATNCGHWDYIMLV